MSVKDCRKEKSKKSKGLKFRAQVNCVCNGNCSHKIDVLRQKDIFEEFSKLGTNYSEQTKYLRSRLKENLNPVIKLKRERWHMNIILSIKMEH